MAGPVLLLLTFGNSVVPCKDREISEFLIEKFAIEPEQLCALVGHK